jgi:hypothetical protein
LVVAEFKFNYPDLDTKLEELFIEYLEPNATSNA